jgi:hypothetical protein
MLAIGREIRYRMVSRSWKDVTWTFRREFRAAKNEKSLVV